MEILKSFPPMEVLCASEISTVKLALDAAHPYAYQLFQWIIQSNLSHIVKLTNDQFVPSMKTRHQFLLLSAAPEKEEKFQSLKQVHGMQYTQRHNSMVQMIIILTHTHTHTHTLSLSLCCPLTGSMYAFHGSSIENWHSIIRQGLRNASGTKLQVNGAAYGKGIYLSTSSSMSLGYCRGAHGRATASTGRFLNDPTTCVCLALCECMCQNTSLLHQS
jgi:poly [ADP-ribose] polymerase 6/8